MAEKPKLVVLDNHRTQTARQTVEKFLKHANLDEMDGVILIGRKPCEDHNHYVLVVPDGTTFKDILWDLECLKQHIVQG